MAKQVNGIVTDTLVFFQNCFLCAVLDPGNRTDTNETVFQFKKSGSQEKKTKNHHR